MEYLREFETQAQCDAYVNGSDYKEPFVGLVGTDVVKYNKASSIDYRLMPLTIEITYVDDDIDNGSGSGSGSGGDSFISLKNGVKYKVNDDEWAISEGSPINVSSGTKVQLKENYSSSGRVITNSNTNYIVYGNIMSIYSEDGFENLTSFTGSETNVFDELFLNCTGLISAENLILPATELTYFCYQKMFRSCSNLTTAPSILPATAVTKFCYSEMFSNCTSLTSAPLLPATSLEQQCYFDMFANCTSLSTAPELPATTLEMSCYSSMFEYCTSLTTAPELPATTLAYGCYQYMFENCTSLNYIKCLATNISASNCTTNWVYNVAENGTFVKNPNMSSWTTGVDGIPEGWDAENA